MSEDGGAPATVHAALVAAGAAGLERLDAQSLLGALLQRPRAWLIAHGEAPLAPRPAQRFGALVARRAAGEPLAYLLGEKEFFGLALQVGPAVLVPRADTETLVDWALAWLASRAAAAPVAPAARVLDLGTGSGAIALAIKRHAAAAHLTAVDASKAALAVAAANGAAHGVAVRWLRSDWFAALGGERFELIVGNPPYIAEGDAHLGALRHEPRAALVSGADGLDALRAICRAAPRHLVPGGGLLLEHGHEQAPAVTALLAAAGFVDIVTRSDLAGRPRCTGGRLPAGVHKGAEAVV